MIILYETWTHSKSNIGINGYKSYNLYRKFQHRRANRCSGGIVVYIKDSISAGVDIVKNHFDTIIWFKLNNKFFKTANDVYLSCVYIWGENSPAYNHIDVDLFSILQSDITHFQSHGTVLLCGDWNARVGNGSRPDYIVCDRYVDSIDDDDYCQMYRYRGVLWIAPVILMELNCLICVNRLLCALLTVDWAMTIKLVHIRIHVTQVAVLLTIYSSVNTISVILQTSKLAHFASGLTMRHCLLIYGAILMQQRMTICIIGIQK